MARPVLRTDRSIGINIRSRRQCIIVLPGDNLTDRISAADVRVFHPATGTDVRVQLAMAVRWPAGGWILIIITDLIPGGHYGDTDEVEVTVTDPDTGEMSDPPTEVVIVDPDPPVFSSKAASVARKKTKSRATAKKAKSKTGKTAKPAKRKSAKSRKT